MLTKAVFSMSAVSCYDNAAVKLLQYKSEEYKKESLY